jgi:hypothetical protein
MIGSFALSGGADVWAVLVPLGFLATSIGALLSALETGIGHVRRGAETGTVPSPKSESLSEAA